MTNNTQKTEIPQIPNKNSDRRSNLERRTHFDQEYITRHSDRRMIRDKSLATSIKVNNDSSKSDSDSQKQRLQVGLTVLALVTVGAAGYQWSSNDSNGQVNNSEILTTLVQASTITPIVPNIKRTKVAPVVQEKIASSISATVTQKERADSKSQRAISIRLEVSKLVTEMLLDESATSISDVSNLVKSLEDIKNKTIVQEPVSDSVDHYNRQTAQANNSKMQNYINQLMNDTSDSNPEYIVKLDKEADVRQNEVRSIALLQGDTLWSLAKRAYGDGNLYHKILKANPHITEESARRLSTGTLIRVPM